MSDPAGFQITRWSTADRLGDILAVVQAAFANLDPPSGALRDTPADVGQRQRDGFILVAFAGADMIGSLYAARKDDALYLTRLAVVPAWQRRGVGRALMQAAGAEARRAGAKRLLLRVRVNLPGNLAYFQAIGFVRIANGQDPGRPPYDVLERPLV